MSVDTERDIMYNLWKNGKSQVIGSYESCN